MATEPRIFYFPQGIPGFETYHEFRFIPEDGTMLARLVSIEEENIGFILMCPEAYFPDYVTEIDVDNESIRILKITEDTFVDVWVILTLNRKELAKTTANLRAPILLNTVEGIGLQMIFNDDKYLCQQQIFTEKGLQPQQEGAVG